MKPALFLVALCLATASRVQAQLRDIIFTDWGRLCSVSLRNTTQVCFPATREYDDIVWSPDRKKLVAAGGALLNQNGRRIGALRGKAGIRPVWSPDGRYIFAVDYTLGSAIRRWTADGGSQRVIPVTDRNASNRRFQMLSFSPSGRRVALLTMGFREMVVADVGPTAFTVTAMRPVGFDYVSQSVWLDEDTLLFVGKRSAGATGSLWRLAVSTGAVDSVGIPGLALRDQIVLAPDRSSVVVTAASVQGETRWNLWHFDLRSHAVRRLTSGTEDIVRSWR
jgi:hypothetical protein